LADLLVRLYDLPPLAPAVDALDRQGIAVRRALSFERPQVTQFALEHGSEGWAAECDAAFARMPLACFVAVERSAKSVAPTPVPVDVSDTLIGFACYEATCRDFFGPQLVHRTSANFATAYNRACAKGYMKSKPLIGVKGANAKKLFLYNAPNANVASIYSSGSRTLLEYPFVSEDGKTQVPSFEELMEAIYCAAHGATKQEQEDSGTCLPD